MLLISKNLWMMSELHNITVKVIAVQMIRVQPYF